MTDKIEVGGTAFLSPCSCAQTEVRIKNTCPGQANISEFKIAVFQADRNTTEGRLLAKEIEGARWIGFFWRLRWNF